MWTANYEERTVNSIGTGVEILLGSCEFPALEVLLLSF